MKHKTFWHQKCVKKFSSEVGQKRAKKLGHLNKSKSTLLLYSQKKALPNIKQNVIIYQTNKRESEKIDQNEIK